MIIGIDKPCCDQSHRVVKVTGRLSCRLLFSIWEPGRFDQSGVRRTQECIMNQEDQDDELLALHSIYQEEFTGAEEEEGEEGGSGPPGGEIRVSVELPPDFSVAMRDGVELRRYVISFLPPLLLTFDLPKDYPSSSPPTYTLTCCWLTHTQLSAVCVHLAHLYEATRGAVVLFTWVQFLREEVLRFLNILGNDQNALVLESSKTEDQAASPPTRPLQSVHSQNGSQSQEKDRVQTASPTAALGAHAVAADSVPSPPNPARTLLSQLLLYDDAQRQKAFEAATFECGVCFVTSPGSECAELSRECGHVYCRSCLAEFCKVQITEGNVLNVACPRQDCSATPTPLQVRRLVGEELFSRYDRLLLQTTLDRMPDVAYCPRRSCGCAVILEAGNRAALCSVCRYAFCVSCRRSYHGTQDCGAEEERNRAEEERIAKAQEERNAKTQVEGEEQEGYYAGLPDTHVALKGLWDDYQSGSHERRKLLEGRYGRHMLKSANWIFTNSQSCPNCYRRIEKNGGCNNMKCSNCGTEFYWLLVGQEDQMR